MELLRSCSVLLLITCGVSILSLVVTSPKNNSLCTWAKTCVLHFHTWQYVQWSHVTFFQSRLHNLYELIRDILCEKLVKLCIFRIPSDWHPGVSIQPALHWLYMVQMGFYLHCAYATIYLETIRRDFVVLMMHHVLTLGLLMFSYIVR